MAKIDEELINFLKGTENLNGFNICDMQNVWTDGDILRRRDWIQYVFPVRRTDVCDTKAYCFSEEFELTDIPQDELEFIQANIRASLIRYLKAIGYNIKFSHESDKKNPDPFVKVRAGVKSKKVLYGWAETSPDNFLQLARILACMSLFEMWPEWKTVCLITKYLTISDIYVPDYVSTIWKVLFFKEYPLFHIWAKDNKMEEEKDVAFLEFAYKVLKEEIEYEQRETAL